MALDGANIPAGGRVVAAVESVVLPVDYRRFAMGMVEAIARPLLPSLDAVMTISMDSSLTGQAALERYVHAGGGIVGIHSALDTESEAEVILGVCDTVRPISEEKGLPITWALPS